MWVERIPELIDAAGNLVSIASITADAGDIVVTLSDGSTSRFPVPGGVPGPKGDPGDTGPAGADGLAATVEVGTVTTGAPGTDAAVENVGTPTAAVLNFTIPRGNPGSGGGGDASFPAVMARVSMRF